MSRSIVGEGVSGAPGRAARVPIAMLALLALVAGLMVPLKTVGAQERKTTAPPACVPVVTSDGASRCMVPGKGKTDAFQDCPACPEMVVVPGGSLETAQQNFDAGASKTQLVTFEKPFAIGKLAVTFAEWDACVAEGGCGGYVPWDQDWGRGRLPVVNVNWSDAMSYVAWLSAKTGKRYRLPHAAEREYATRAGTTTPYWWGNGISLDDANVDLPVPSMRRGEGAVEAWRDVRHQTVAADAFRPNPWGLFNVHGNVWDWTADCALEADDDATNAAAPQADTAASCGTRFSMGGSWNDFAEDARAGARTAFAADSRNALQGFRVVRELP